MPNNRYFTFNDLVDFTKSLGYQLEYSRPRQVFTLINIQNPLDMTWVYRIDNPEVLVALINDLTIQEWKLTIVQNIENHEKESI